MILLVFFVLSSRAQAEAESAPWRRSVAQLSPAGPVQPGTSELSDFATMESARSALEKIPIYAAIRDVYPAEFEELLKIFRDGYARGQTMQEVKGRVRPILERIVVRSMIVAPSEDVIELFNVTLSYIEELNKIDAESCVGYLNPRTGARPTVNLAETFPLLAARELAVSAKIIRAAPLSKRRKPSLREVATDMRAAAASLRRTHGKKIALLASWKKISPADFPDYCQMNIDSVRFVLALPMERAAGMIRYTTGLLR